MNPPLPSLEIKTSEQIFSSVTYCPPEGEAQIQVRWCKCDAIAARLEEIYKLWKYALTTNNKSSLALAMAKHQELIAELRGKK